MLFFFKFISDFGWEYERPQNLESSEAPLIPVFFNYCFYKNKTKNLNTVQYVLILYLDGRKLSTEKFFFYRAKKKNYRA